MSKEEKRVCTACQEERPGREFRVIGLYTSKKTGVTTPTHDRMCMECRKERNRKYMRQYKPAHTFGFEFNYGYVFEPEKYYSWLKA